MARAHFSSVMPGSQDQVFATLFQADNWERGLPLTLTAKLERRGPVREGTELTWRVNRYGLSFLWTLKIEDIEPGKSLTLTQTLGFFESWSHITVLETHAPGKTLLKDSIDYEMPLGLFGKLADDLIFRMDLEKMLESRHENVRRQLEK